jgi:hypothetical protein
MSQIKVNLVKEEFSKPQFSKVVDTSITQLVPPPATTTVPTEVSIEEFFLSYENLFAAIPKFGETNSHEYLVIQSGNYINLDNQQEEIKLLLEEINALRQDLLDANTRILELESTQTNG